jgi:hypothetical protein
MLPRIAKVVQLPHQNRNNEENADSQLQERQVRHSIIGLVLALELDVVLEG